MFPNGDSCLRLVRALAVETHENWLEQHRYLNMDDLREHKKEASSSVSRLMLDETRIPLPFRRWR